MRMVKRAASATRTAASNYSANGQYRRPTQLSNSSSGGSGGGGTTLVIILVIALVGVGGFFALKKIFPSKPKVQEVVEVPVIKELPSDEGNVKEEPKKV